MFAYIYKYAFAQNLMQSNRIEQHEITIVDTCKCINSVKCHRKQRGNIEIFLLNFAIIFIDKLHAIEQFSV